MEGGRRWSAGTRGGVMSAGGGRGGATAPRRGWGRAGRGRGRAPGQGSMERALRGVRRVGVEVLGDDAGGVSGVARGFRAWRVGFTRGAWVSPLRVGFTHPTRGGATAWSEVSWLKVRIPIRPAGVGVASGRAMPDRPRKRQGGSAPGRGWGGASRRRRGTGREAGGVSGVAGGFHPYAWVSPLRVGFTHPTAGGDGLVGAARALRGGAARPKARAAGPARAAVRRVRRCAGPRRRGRRGGPGRRAASGRARGGRAGASGGLGRSAAFRRG